MVRIAVAQYELKRPADWAGYAQRLTTWVADAAAQGAGLVVFPEYAGLELGGLCLSDRRLTPRRLYPAMQPLLPDARALHRELAQAYGVVIVAGSLPVAVGADRFSNRVHVVAPNGAAGYQDKIQLTRLEQRTELMAAGTGLHVFDMDGVRFGIALCYDSQFPLLSHAMAEAGADLIVSPSCTHAATGFNRVRIGCRARALENQCYTAQAPLVGDVPWFPLMGTNVGRAGVFTPPDNGVPSDGILVEGTDDTPGWVVTDLDPALVQGLRRHGQVGNAADWVAQYQALATGVTAVSLGHAL